MVMALVRSSKGFKSFLTPFIYRVCFSSNASSTSQTPISSTPTTTPTPKTPIFSTAETASYLSAAKTLNPSSKGWVTEEVRKPTTKVEVEEELGNKQEEPLLKQEEGLRSQIKYHRKRGHFHKALQVSNQMSKQRHILLSPVDIATRLEMLFKVHGLNAAEQYFKSIPKESRAKVIYVALLNCYVHGKWVEKVEALMLKREELGLGMSMFYDILLNLYYEVGQYDKLHNLVEELKEKGLHQTHFRLRIQLSFYEATSNIEGVEKILQTMEADPKFKMTWKCCVTAASGYIKAGLIVKALEMLKKSEGLVRRHFHKKRMSYNHLLELYGRTGRKDELYRYWKVYKGYSPVDFKAYHFMVTTLLKLDDFAGAEQIVKKWGSRGDPREIELQKLLLDACSKKPSFAEG